METTYKSLINPLSRLYKIVEAGERGYIVAASSVKNRALKVLFKSYAQDRVRYKEEIWQEMQRFGATTKPAGSVLAALHRGRISIFAALTIGEENIEQVVLKEVTIGENVALRTYVNTLKEELPADTRALIQRQYAEVRQVVDKVQMMRGRDGERLMVRLYDTEADADRAIRKLKESGYSAENIMNTAVAPLEPYHGPAPSLVETMLSGAVGGSLWGIISAILATISIFQAPRLGLDTPTVETLQATMVAIIIGLIAAGVFVGGGLGFIIGLGIRNEDAYLYDESLEHGRRLVEVQTDVSRASSVWQLLHQVNMEARAARV